MPLLTVRVTASPRGIVGTGEGVDCSRVVVVRPLLEDDVAAVVEQRYLCLGSFAEGIGVLVPPPPSRRSLPSVRRKADCYCYRL